MKISTQNILFFALKFNFIFAIFCSFGQNGDYDLVTDEIEDYETATDEIEKSTEINLLGLNSSIDTNYLLKYRKLIINDVAINLDNDGENEFNSDAQIYKAYYKDDLYFECDLPVEITQGKYKWLVNGHFLKNGVFDFDEPAYTLVLNEKIESNTSFLNVSCHFNVEHHATSLQFPLIHLGNLRLLMFLFRKSGIS